jgi:hypothetical protein
MQHTGAVNCCTPIDIPSQDNQGLRQLGTCAMQNRLSPARKSARHACISVSCNPYRCSSGLYIQTVERVFWYVTCVAESFGPLVMSYWTTRRHTPEIEFMVTARKSKISHCLYFTNTISNHYMFVPMGHHHRVIKMSLCTRWLQYIN